MKFINKILLIALWCGIAACSDKTALQAPPEISVGLMTTPDVTLTLKDAKGTPMKTLVYAAADVDSCVSIEAPEGGAIEISNVKIGIGFHWEQCENQSFEGKIALLRTGDSLTVINRIDIERYLESVISSEMSANSSAELLRAHAIISRSWLLAQLDNKNLRAVTRHEADGEVTVWYDRDDHTLFDVCADDHCQRYQGITRRTNEEVATAVRATRGMVVESDGMVCDARFSKCCGGVTEEFENCWEPEHKPYLEARRDFSTEFPVPDLTKEPEASQWINSRPDAFCAAPSKEVLAAVLNSYDRATTDFYRWSVSYSTDSLSRLFAARTGRSLGTITELIPLERGKSGRITRLKIVGDQDSIIIGKELEIRRSLSPSHLYSSAFTVEKTDSGFTLHGAGWGHGVGLCQIGAAVMGASGYSYKEILSHYFPNSTITTIYQ